MNVNQINRANRNVLVQRNNRLNNNFREVFENVKDYNYQKDSYVPDKTEDETASELYDRRGMTKNLTEENTLKDDSKESETDTRIIVKPDGSRVLLVTINIGGMKTAMSLEISKPTKILNEHESDIKSMKVN